MNSGNEQQQLAEFLNSAALNLRKVLEGDPEISTRQIEAILHKLPHLLLATAPLLEQSSDDTPAMCLLSDA